MIKINLLPPETIAERVRRRVRIRVTIAAVMLLAVAASGYYLLLDRTANLEANAETLEQSLQRIEAQFANYEPYVQLQSEVSSQVDSLKTAFGTVPDWITLLEDISAEIPENVWLTELNMAYDTYTPDSIGFLLVRGLTHHHPSTARWLTAMGQIQGLGEVRCAVTIVADLDPIDETDEELVEQVEEIGEMVKFEITAEILPGKPHDPLAREGE